MVTQILYLRFALPKQNPVTGIKDGVFKVSYEVSRDGGLSEQGREGLRDLLRRFGENPEVPTRFNRTKSKGFYRRITKGVSWLKSSADPHVAKMRRMAAILRNRGHQVAMIKTSTPGYVVSEDDHQIVAEPFDDLGD